MAVMAIEHCINYCMGLIGWPTVSPTGELHFAQLGPFYQTENLRCNRGWLDYETIPVTFYCPEVNRSGCLQLLAI